MLICYYSNFRMKMRLRKRKIKNDLKEIIDFVIQNYLKKRTAKNMNKTQLCYTQIAMKKKWNKYNNKLKMFYNHKLIIFLNKTKEWIRTSTRLKIILKTPTSNKMKREPLVKFNKIQNIQMT